MKKITIFIALVAVTFLACQKQKNVTPTSQQETVTVEQASNQSTSARPAETSRIRVKIRHTAEADASNPSPPPCEEPFWICVIFGGSALKTGELISNEERIDNIAAVDLVLIDKHHLKLIPDAKFTDVNNIFKMTDNMILDPITSAKLGFETVTIKKGTYTLNPNEGAYGSVIVKVKSKKINENEEDSE